MTHPTASQNLVRGLLRFAAGALLLVATWQVAGAQQQTVLGQANAVVTGFSGAAALANPPASGNALDARFIDVGGASAKILSLPIPSDPPQGQIAPASTVLPVKAGDVGQVFGIALDDGKGPDGTASGVPDIYLAASSAFGLQIVGPDAAGKLQRLHKGQPGAQWMAGQWGDPAKNGTPGSIWKVSGSTGAVSLFANVVLNGQPNSGPGLGNIAFDPTSRQIFVSDLETGMIHRFDMHGQDLGYYDHGAQGRLAQGLAPVSYDPTGRLDIASPAFDAEDAASWHFAPKGRSVWGLKVSAGRLYYAIADGPQVWSISIATDGSFGSDPKLEIDLAGAPTASAISDIAFDGPETIYLAQRGAAHGDYSYESFAEPGKAALLRYARNAAGGTWVAKPDEYAVGFPPANRNTNGGVAIDTCNKFVWTTGERLRVGAGLGDPEVVHGLQGMDKSLVLPANQPPKQSLFTPYDPAFTDADAHGHMGDVEIWHPCQSVGEIAPQPQPQPQPVPVVPAPDLSILKTADGPCAPIPGGGFACNYTVTVTNSGSAPYVGPIEVTDKTGFNLGQLSTSSAPPWTCVGAGTATLVCQLPTPAPGITPAVTLNRGDNVQLHVTESIAQGDVSSASCQVPNSAAITQAPGGDSDPSDNISSATATLPDPSCIPVPPPGPNLTVLKTGGPCTPLGNGGDFDCTYTVTVTNTGTAPFSGPITVTDTIGTTHGAPQFGPPWTCIGSLVAQCSLPGNTTLLPGQSAPPLTDVMHVAHGDLSDTQCNLVNTAALVVPTPGSSGDLNANDDTASATGVINDPNCIPPPPQGSQSDISLSKSSEPECSQLADGNFDCLYTITATNQGPAPFNDVLSINDTLPPFD